MNKPQPSSNQDHLKKQAQTVMRDAELESFRDIADDVIESDFVPYACLFDPHTVATKNGELVQTIKITGLGFDAQHQTNLRGAIREAIQKSIPDETYAIWLHTLRRRQQLVKPSEFPDKFTAAVDAGWSETHPASASFVTELYITIVHAGQDASLKNFKDVLRATLIRREMATRSEFLTQSLRNLDQITQRMLSMLQPFRARLLSIVERADGHYSEQLEFLEKIINLEERPMPVPLRDLSQVLTSGDITFGYNTMEVRTAEGKRRFACIMTIKEYKESTLSGIDRFLDIPCEMIITQCFDFIGGDKAREAYEKQSYYLSISGDKQLGEWMEINRLMQANTQRGFGEQQTTLFVIAPSVKQLEQNVRLTQKALNKLGIIAIREDLRFEECYWAQLPGNFPFVSRKHSVDTEHLAGFATVQTQPIGNATGSPWGPPVSLFTTVQDAPFFFNFHRDSSAHSIVLGKPRSGRTSIAHFLLAQARRLPVRQWYIDCHGRGETFVEAMGGRVAKPGTPQCALNPLGLADTPANREFLAIWLSTLVDPEGKHLTRSSLEFFQSLIVAVMQLPREQRRLSALLPIVRQQDAMLAQQFQRFCAGGEFGELFDMPVDNFDPGTLTVWNIAAWSGAIATRAPLASYLLHRLTTALDGTPTVLVLDEGFDLLANPLFGLRSPAWMDYLSQKNTGLMLLCETIEASANYPFTLPIAQKTASIFAMPDPNPGAEYAYGFTFTEADLSTLGYMKSSERHVLLKRGEQSTLLKMDLGNLGAQLTTLSGRAAIVPQKSPADLLSELMGYGAPVGALA